MVTEYRTLCEVPDNGLDVLSNLDISRMSEKVTVLLYKAVRGDLQAQNELGNCYYNGAGVPENKQETLK